MQAYFFQVKSILLIIFLQHLRPKIRNKVTKSRGVVEGRQDRFRHGFEGDISAVSRDNAYYQIYDQWATGPMENRRSTYRGSP